MAPYYLVKGFNNQQDGCIISNYIEACNEVRNLGGEDEISKSMPRDISVFMKLKGNPNIEDEETKKFIADWRILVALVALNDERQCDLKFTKRQNSGISSELNKIFYDSPKKLLGGADFNCLCGQANSNIIYNYNANADAGKNTVLGLTSSFWIVSPCPDFSEAIAVMERDGLLMPALEDDITACKMVGMWIYAAKQKNNSSVLQKQLTLYEDYIKQCFFSISKNKQPESDGSWIFTATENDDYNAIVTSTTAGLLFQDEDNGTLHVSPDSVSAD